MDDSIAEIIRDADTGDRIAADRLFTAMYADLHRLAERQLSRNNGQLTLGTTTLLHEAYMSMASREGASYCDQAHFMAHASRGPDHLEALGKALNGLSELDRPLAELVDLYFSCGFAFGEIAAMRLVSERTVYRDWRKARLLLRRTLLNDEPDTGAVEPG